MNPKKQEKKYILLTDETMKTDSGITLTRIQRINDGRRGGWVQSEMNLSQQGKCWIGGEAKVFETAFVSGDALVNGCAEITGHAKVFDKAWVTGDSRVGNFAQVYGHAKVFNKAMVCSQAKVYGNVVLKDYVTVLDQAEVFGNAELTGCMSCKGKDQYTQTSFYLRLPLDIHVTITEKYIYFGFTRFKRETYQEVLKRKLAVYQDEYGCTLSKKQQQVYSAIVQEAITIFDETL